jgi:hypothetical protein
MGSLSIEGAGEKTVVRVKEDGFGTAQIQLSHDDMAYLFVQWLNEVPQEARMKVISGIILEHQVSYHINMKSEEESLQELNFHEENAIDVIRGAIRDVTGKVVLRQVYVPHVYERLKEVHADMPPHTVEAVLWDMCYENKARHISARVFGIR